MIESTTSSTESTIQSTTEVSLSTTKNSENLTEEKSKAVEITTTKLIDRNQDQLMSRKPNKQKTKMPQLVNFHQTMSDIETLDESENKESNVKEQPAICQDVSTSECQKLAKRNLCSDQHYINHVSVLKKCPKTCGLC